VLKKELLWIPVFGWGLALLKPIAIERNARLNAIQQVLKTGEKRLKQGLWVVIFPQGSRILPGDKARKWGKSFAVLSEKTEVPVIPIAHNAGKYWTRKGFCKKAGTIEIVIGAPIYPENKGPNAIFEQTKVWIENHEKP
jgi:1-acyl-sn-glycerol-3-phosphate acyltransferase